MDDLDRQIDADYERDKTLLAGADNPRDIYALGWLKGRTAGLTAGMEYSVIGEHVDEDLLQAVRGERTDIRRQS